MSFNADQPPTPVSESTAIEVVRLEGSAKSFVTNAAITAGDILKLGNSGAIQTVGGETAVGVLGVALFTASSGQRVTVIKGRIRARWDGVGTPAAGDPINLSFVRSGWFSISGAVQLSGLGSIGRYEPLPGGTTLAAANSGLLAVVAIP